MCLSVCVQDGRADVVANDAGDRVTPAVVGYRDTEQVKLHLLRQLIWIICHSQIMKLFLHCYIKFHKCVYYVQYCPISFTVVKCRNDADCVHRCLSSSTDCGNCSKTGTSTERCQHGGPSETSAGQKVTRCLCIQVHCDE